MSIALPYPNMSFTPLDVLTAEEMNQIVANYTYIANNTSGGGGGGGASILDCYPVGSYYETSDTSFNPNVTWGGTWVLDSQGRVTVAQNSGTFATIGSTGGSESASHYHTTSSHTLTLSEIPSHSHSAYNSSFVESDQLIHTGSVGKSVSSLSSGDAHIAFTYSTGVTHSSSTTWYAGGGQGHTHGNTGNATASTIQPYVVVRRWHRTA